MHPAQYHFRSSPAIANSSNLAPFTTNPPSVFAKCSRIEPEGVQRKRALDEEAIFLPYCLAKAQSARRSPTGSLRPSRVLEVFSPLEGFGLALGFAGPDKFSVLGSQNELLEKRTLTGTCVCEMSSSGWLVQNSSSASS